jgi:polygalacturonase
MNRVHLILAAGLAGLALTAGCATSAETPAQAGPAQKGEITAALPVIPDARFNLTDFGGVGDYKAFNTDAFKSAVAAIAKAGGGHLIVPAGTYKTLPFTLTSHMDLHLEAGATIKVPRVSKSMACPIRICRRPLRQRAPCHPPVAADLAGDRESHP